MRYRWCTLGRALATAGAILLSAMAVPASAEYDGQPCDPNGQAVAYGAVLAGCTINPVADLDTFTFTAASGDEPRLILTTTAGSTGAVLCIEVRAPDNTTFLPMTCGNFDMVLAPISVAGNYQVFVTEQGNNGTLVFNLSLERLFPLRAPVPVPPGAVLTGREINPVADLDTFFFTAAPDDVLRLISTVTAGSTGAILCIEIRGPDNMIFLMTTCGNLFDRVLDPVPVAGIYQVVITENGNNGTLVFNMSLSCLSGTCASRHVDRDFNGDGTSDILWRHTSGLVYEWLLNGTTIASQCGVGGVTSDWIIAGAGDFNGDKKSDILWRHTSGTVYVWLMNGCTIINQGVVGGVTSDWAIAGVGDFNGDQKSDILWRNTSGLVYEWLLDGTNIIGQGAVGGATSDWTIAGVGDFNGDQRSDIVWRHTSGLVYEWLLNGTIIIGQGGFGAVTSDWAIAGVGDFNADKKSDILWRRTSGTVYIWLLDGTTIIGHGGFGEVTSDWTIVRAGDFNGDGASDIMWRHTSGLVYEWLLAGLAIVGQGSPGGATTDWQIQ